MQTANSVGTLIGFAVAALVVSGFLTLLGCGANELVSKKKLTKPQVLSIWSVALIITVVLMFVGSR